MNNAIGWRSFFLGGLAVLLALIVIALLVVLTGGYNVAAADRHNPVVAWALTTTMDNSVKGRAEDIVAPELTPAMVAAGAGAYKAMCEHCHGGVGAGRAGWTEGMLPHPPALAHAAKQWEAQEVFWLAKHGVKMTGMPAFGPTHDDRALWNITAFVKALPDMSAQEYADYGSAPSSGGQDQGHSHAGGS